MEVDEALDVRGVRERVTDEAGRLLATESGKRVAEEAGKLLVGEAGRQVAGAAGQVVNEAAAWVSAQSAPAAAGKESGSDAEAERAPDGASLVRIVGGQLSREMVYRATKGIATDGAERLRGFTSADTIRPFFDVTGPEVLRRLVWNLLPSTQSVDGLEHPDVYGPLMVVFTLVAVLICGVNLHGTRSELRDATVLGTSFFTSFSYWLGASALLFLLSLILEIRLTLFQVLHCVGYTVAGSCLALLFGIFVQGVSFALIFLVLVGLSGASLAWTVYRRTPVRRHAVAAAACALAMHALFALYLRFAYHMIDRINI